MNVVQYEIEINFRYIYIKYIFRDKCTRERKIFNAKLDDKLANCGSDITVVLTYYLKKKKKRNQLSLFSPLTLIHVYGLP